MQRQAGVTTVATVHVVTWHRVLRLLDEGRDALSISPSHTTSPDLVFFFPCIVVLRAVLFCRSKQALSTCPPSPPPAACCLLPSGAPRLCCPGCRSVTLLSVCALSEVHSRLFIVRHTLDTLPTTVSVEKLRPFDQQVMMVGPSAVASDINPRQRKALQGTLSDVPPTGRGLTDISVLKIKLTNATRTNANRKRKSAVCHHLSRHIVTHVGYSTIRASKARLIC